MNSLGILGSDLLIECYQLEGFTKNRFDSNQLLYLLSVINYQLLMFFDIFKKLRFYPNTAFLNFLYSLFKLLSIIVSHFLWLKSQKGAT